MPRIHMTRSTDYDHEGGGYTRFRGDELYIVGEDLAEELVSKDRAYYEGEPPTCGVCGETFEGLGAWNDLRTHEQEGHEDVIRTWDPGSGKEPPALDYDHPQVEALEEETIEDLREEAHRLGVADDEIVATGASGVVKEDWIRHVLRARGVHFIYETPSDEGEEE